LTSSADGELAIGFDFGAERAAENRFDALTNTGGDAGHPGTGRTSGDCEDFVNGGEGRKCRLARRFCVD